MANEHAPFELMTGPCEVWVSPDLEETVPGMGTTVSGDWVLLGENGEDNITEEGVTVELSATKATFTPFSKTLATKVWNTNEEQHVRFTLADDKVTPMAYALNGQSVTTTPADMTTVGNKSIQLTQGLNVTEYSLLIRFDKSPYGLGGVGGGAIWRQQYYFPRVYQAGSVAKVYVKGTPAALAFDFMVLASTTEPKLMQVHAAATG